MAWTILCPCVNELKNDPILNGILGVAFEKLHIFGIS